MNLFTLACYPRHGTLFAFVFATKREAYIKLLEVLRLSDDGECKDCIDGSQWRRLDEQLEDYPDLPLLEWAIEEQPDPAPKLLEACKALLDATDLDTPAQLERARVQAKAAIAKAGGAS